MAHGHSHGQLLIEKFGASAEAAGDLAVVGWLGAILAIGGIAGIVFCELQRTRLAFRGLALSATAFSLGLFAVAAVRFDRHKPTPELAEAIHRYADGDPQVAQFGYFQPSLVYYADTHVEACKNPQRVIEFLSSSTDAFLITTADNYDKLAAQLPADVAVLDRQADFPRAGSVILLGRKTALAQYETKQTREK